MSLRTALTIILSALLTALLIYFVLHNDVTLREQLTVFSFSFSVISALVAGMLIASAVPSAYFSVQWFKANRKLKKHGKAGKVAVKNEEVWGRISGLIAHGNIELASKLVSQVQPDDQPTHRLIRASILMEECQYAEVITMLEPDFQKEALPEEGYLLSEAYAMSGNEERSTVVLETLVNRYPDDSVHALDLLIEDALDQEKWQETLKWAQKRQSLPGGKNPELEEMVLGVQYEILKDESKEADKKYVGRLANFMKEHKSFVPGHILLSQVYLEMEQENKAIKQLETGFEETLHHELLERVVAHYLGKEQPEEAIRLMKQISVSRNSRLASFELARLYYKLAMYKDSIDVLEGLTRSFKKHQLLWHLLAQAEMKTGNETKALEYLERALAKSESGVVILGEFVCDFCGNLSEKWADRCEECGSWNTVRLNLEPIDEAALESPPISYS